MPNDGRRCPAYPSTVEGADRRAKLQKEHSFGHVQNFAEPNTRSNAILATLHSRNRFETGGTV